MLTSCDYCASYHYSFFTTGVFIGFEKPSYTFQEPTVFWTSIREVALVTSNEFEQQFIAEITIVPGSATRDVGFGGDYEFGGDYVYRVIFDPGVTRQIVPFWLIPDDITEGTESFTIRATRSMDGPPYECVSPCISETTIYILDNYSKCAAFQLQNCTQMNKMALHNCLPTKLVVLINEEWVS